MEYIEGDTLAAFAAAHSMSGRRRLELFCRICDAVQYAHSRGVIHRDLKPANILVDRLGQPRILDFGVARLIDPVVCAIRPQTQAGQVVGTIPYMSPEQAAGRSDLVDCRCDVHALGVILYELMCGQLPYRIEGLSLHEAIRVMQQEDPVPLGRRSGDCRGDVEAICDTAMQRVLARRYASVADLRSDIQRHLEGRPVAARQLTRAEQFMKFARRHRTLVAMAAAVLLTLLLGVAATVHQAVKAQEEARVAQACLRFFREAMTGSSLLSQYGRDATVRERLIAMRDMIPTRFADQPAVCAEVEYILGVACFNVGELEFAEEALRHSLTLRNRLLPADHPDVLSTQFHLASALQGLGRVREAEQIHREVLAIRQRDAAVPSVELALSLNSVGGALFLQDRWEEALRLQRAACEMHRGLDNADPVLAGNASFGLATTLCIMGANEEAMSLLAQAEQMFIDGDAEGSTLHAQLLVRRASSLRALGEDEAAGECFERALRMQRQQSPHSQWTEIALRYYAGHLWARGAYGEAEPMFCEAVAIARDVLPADHPQLADSLNSLGVCLRDMDRLEEAEPLLLEALRIRRLVLGEERLAVSHSLINLAKLRYKAGRWAEAQQDAASALRIRLRHRNELHPEVVEARRVLDALEPDDSLSIAAVEPPAE
jgi:tetratricopeptide (TPR) repeat protein